MLVFGSIGPLEAPVHGPDRFTDGRSREAFREQIEGLLEGGADVLLFETFSDLEELLLGVAEARTLCDLPIVAQMTFGEELLAIDGSSPQTAATALAAAGVDAVGVNCGVGPTICLDALVQMGRPSAGLARSIVPNAGLPQRIEGQFVYAAPPAYFGEAVARFVDAGATIVGGCCGTTPEHIRHMREALDALSGATASHDGRGRGRGLGQPTTERLAGPRTPIAERYSGSAGSGGSGSEPPPPTRLAGLLDDKRFVISVEIDPPRSVRIDRTIEAARLLRDAGVDLVNISDSAMARVRMGALAVAFGIQHDLDLECLVHFTTRDRNLMALESELLGAHALGVRDILALTGDPPRVGDYPTGTGHLGRRLDWADRDPEPPQPRRGPGGQAHRRAGRVHRCVRAGPNRRGPGAGDGAPRRQARRRCRCDHDPAHLCRPSNGTASWTPPRSAGRAACLAPCCWAFCRCTRSVTPSSCTTRCPASPSPTRSGRRWLARASVVRRSASISPTRCSIEMADDGPGHVHHAQLRTLRAGRRARPPRPRGQHHRPATGRARMRHYARLIAAAWLALLTLPATVLAQPPAGPPFPPPETDRVVYDFGDILSPQTEASVTATITEIEQRTGAELVVYTQYKPGSTEESTNSDAVALIDQWGVGRLGFDDGMAIMWNTNRETCLPNVSGNGQVNLYGAPGYAAAYASNEERQDIFDNTMVPLLRECDEDGALLAAMERLDALATPEHAQRLATARLIDALVGVGGVVLALLLIGWTLFSWLRYGRDPVYLDDASILMPAPPPDLTAASGAVVWEGGATRRALTTAMLDLASRGYITFIQEDAGVLGIGGKKAGTQLNDPDTNDPQVLRNRRRPLSKAEEYAYQELGDIARAAGGSYIEPDEMLKFGAKVATFDSRIEGHVVDKGWFRERPKKVTSRWAGRGGLALVGGVIAVIVGFNLPSGGLTLLGASLIVAGVVILVIARAMPARTMAGAMIYAMLAAYRRTLQKTMEQARSMQQVVQEAHLDWLETPDQAVVWGTALGLNREVEEVLSRSAEDASHGVTTYNPWLPVWYASSATYGSPNAGYGGMAPGLFSSGALPDFNGMMNVLGTIGNSPSSSGSGGSGGFSGGSSGGGGGGAGGGY